MAGTFAPLNVDDLRDHPMPNLQRLLRTSAVADLTTRAVTRRTSLGDGYTTLGAGARAQGVPAVDGFGFAALSRREPGRGSNWYGWDRSSCLALVLQKTSE